MSGITNEGGFGGVDLSRFIEDADHAQEEVEVKDEVNTLPEVDELSGKGEVDITVDDRDIPRPPPQNGEQRILGEMISETEPDVSTAVGGSLMLSVSESVEEGSYSGSVNRGGNGSISITVTDPEGVTREGGVDEDGHQYVRTDLVGVGSSTVRFNEVDDGEMTVSVEPDDGSGPHELTLEVDEATEDDIDRFNEDDLDKTPDDKQSWVQMLEIINSAAKHLEEWIAQGWEKGKPNI